MKPILKALVGAINEALQEERLTPMSEAPSEPSNAFFSFIERNQGPAVVGALVLGLGCGCCFFFGRRRMKDSEFIRDLPLVTIGQLPSLLAANPEDSVIVKIQGQICSPAEPLVAPLSGLPVVMFQTVKIRHYEEKRQLTLKLKKRSKTSDVQGETAHERHKWKTGEEKYAVDNRKIDFYISDPTGLARVSSDLCVDWIGARYFRLVKSKDEYEPVNVTSDLHASKRTIGYSCREYVLPIGQQVFLVAEASLDPHTEGGIILRRPQKKSMFDNSRLTTTYLITLNSEEGLLDDIEKRGFLWLGSATILSVLALGGLTSVYLSRGGSFLPLSAALALLVGGGTTLFLYGQSRREERRNIVNNQLQRAEDIPTAPALESTPRESDSSTNASFSILTTSS